MDLATNVLAMKGAISELPSDERDKIMAVAQTLRGIRAANGEAGMLALLLVAGEVALEAEQK
jgi:hypothetical protein